jgi:hypothetical protein
LQRVDVMFSIIWWDGGNEFCLDKKRRTVYLCPLITNGLIELTSP